MHSMLWTEKQVIKLFWLVLHRVSRVLQTDLIADIFTIKKKII